MIDPIPPPLTLIAARMSERAIKSTSCRRRGTGRNRASAPTKAKIKILMRS